MPNPKQRSACPLYSIPGSRTRAVGMANAKPEQSLMCYDVAIGLSYLPDPQVGELMDQGLPMCSVKQQVPQGGQCTLEETDLLTPLFPETLGAPMSRDCGEMKGEWVEVPHPTVDTAEYQGEFTDYTYIYYQFRIEGRIRGVLKCSDECKKTEITAEYPYTLVFSLKQMILMMVVPGRVAKIIRMIRLAGLAGKAVGLAKAIYEDREIMKYVLKMLGPAIHLLMDSADLICKGTFDPKQLREKLPSNLPPGDWI